MNNETISNRTNNVTLVEAEALRDQIYSIFNNLNMVYLGLSTCGHPEYSSALEPILNALEDANKRADVIMNKVKSQKIPTENLPTFQKD